MLVDVDPLYDSPEKIQKMPQAAQDFWKTLSPESQSHLIPVRIEQGIWEGGLNPTHLVEASNLHEFVMSMGNLYQTHDDTRDGWTIMKESGFLSAYGVCDGIQNLLTHPQYADILNGSRQFTVFMTEIRREHEEPGGWRWHKWGPYIGSQEPTTEYLYDEEEIESVWLFNIVEHKPRTAETSVHP